MKHFLIITNTTKDPELTFTNEVCEYIRSKSHKATLLLHEEKETGWESEIPQDADAILVLGGDGTLLKAARDTAQSNIPLLGINIGTLGFLAEVEKDEYKQSIDALIEGQYFIGERMMLDAWVYRDGEVICEMRALNDVVVNRFGSLMVVPFEIGVNGHPLNQYQADGVIVSTPTGSTGYNMSAGGPIVEPGAQILVITPICPHTLNARSIVLPAEESIEIVIGNNPSGREYLAEVNYDANPACQLKTGDQIKIKRSNQKIRLIHINKVSFIKTLHKKMSESEG